MGSQIFDYWYVCLLELLPLLYLVEPLGAKQLSRFDPSKFILEHYVDGDLVEDETPINRSKASPDNLHVWGNLSCD